MIVIAIVIIIMIMIIIMESYLNLWDRQGVASLPWLPLATPTLHAQALHIVMMIVIVIVLPRKVRRRKRMIVTLIKPATQIGDLDR